MMSKGSSYIILVLISGFCKLLELRHNKIIAAGTFAERAHEIMNLLAAVNTEDHISHLFVAEFHYLIIEQDAVGGKGKTEFFIMDFLLLAAICYQVFYNLPVHKRLAAEKVNLQIVPGARIGDKEIQCLLAHLKRHKGTSSVIFPFFCKAVAAGKITVMCNVQAEGFHHCLTVLCKCINGILVYILCEKHAFFPQLLTFCH